MTSKTICVLGGTGFVGHQVVSQLTKAGYYVVVPSRNRERHRSLQVLPKVDVVDADIFDEDSLNALFVGCDAVINLVAILNENAKDEFRKVHIELVEKVISACKSAGVNRLLHISALNADAQNGASGYLKSKGEGEALIKASGLDYTVFRPSVLFGKDDRFFNKFANLLTNLPVLPLACGDAQMAPFYVGDLAELMVKTMTDKRAFSQTYELSGPDFVTLKQIVDYVNRLTHKRRVIIPLGNGASAMMGRIGNYLPFKPFTYDNFLSLQVPAVSDKPFPKEFGIEPHTIDSIVPMYIGRQDIRGRYDDMRQQAAREKELLRGDHH